MGAQKCAPTASHIEGNITLGRQNGGERAIDQWQWQCEEDRAICTYFCFVGLLFECWYCGRIVFPVEMATSGMRYQIIRLLVRLELFLWLDLPDIGFLVKGSLPADAHAGGSDAGNGVGFRDRNFHFGYVVVCCYVFA
jgi:hypothetical protein